MTQPNTDKRLLAIFERIERVEAERKGLAEDIREIFAEAKGLGYDPKIMRKVLAMRKMDDAARAEQAALLETYMAALGMPDLFNG